MPEAVIVDAIRTPIGRAMKGSLRDIRADDLAAIPLRALVERNPEVDFAETNDIMMGCGFPEGEQGYNVGRNAQSIAGIDHHVPAVTVAVFAHLRCRPSGWPSTPSRRAKAIKYIAAGVECVSRGAAQTFPLMNPHIDGSDGASYNVYISMGITAENVAERCKVSRESQDEWAALSQQRASAARESGHFDREIVGVDIPGRPRAGGNVIEGTHGNARRRPAPRHDSGEACPTQARLQARWDGHRGQRVPAQRRCRSRVGDVRGQGPHAGPQAQGAHSRVLGGGGSPGDHGSRPDPGDQGGARDGGHDDRGHRLGRDERGVRGTGRGLPRRTLGIDPDKPNTYGGAIALGHPFGMTGARIMNTLLNNLDAVDGTLGIESMCVAGGMGQAMIVERLN